MARPEHLPEKPFSPVCNASGAQHKVQRGTSAIHCIVELDGLLVDPSIRLIHMRRILGGTQIRPILLAQLRGVALHPAKHG
jgi:hypothetical protein